MEQPLLTCRELIDFLGAYLDGELAPEPRAAFDAHLSRLPRLRRLPRRLPRDDPPRQAGLRSGRPSDVPSELVDAILAARRS